MHNTSTVKNLVVSALCLALCMVLPFLTGQIPQIGSMLSPMHIPVLLCGFLAGAPYGALVGFVAPILRFFIFQMPPLMPTGAAMAFEMATYGLAAGLLYKALPKTTANLYLSLILSMIAGRLVWGLVSLVLYSIQGNAFTLSIFLSGALLKAIPGIILHLVIIPPLVMALRKVLSKNAG